MSATTPMTEDPDENHISQAARDLMAALIASLDEAKRARERRSVDAVQPGNQV